MGIGKARSFRKKYFRVVFARLSRHMTAYISLKNVLAPQTNSFGAPPEPICLQTPCEADRGL